MYNTNPKASDSFNDKREEKKQGKPSRDRKQQRDNKPQF